MGLFSKSNPPTFSRNDIGDNEKLVNIVFWFIENDKFVTAIKNRNSNIIFSEGYRPIIFKETNPEDFKKDIPTFIEWFMIQISVDLNGLKNVSKERFKEFIDVLGKMGDKTLITSGEIAHKYKLDMERFNYDVEIEKIPEGKEREEFKYNFLLDNAISAEMRILAWLYNEWFSEQYKPI